MVDKNRLLGIVKEMPQKTRSGQNAELLKELEAVLLELCKKKYSTEDIRDILRDEGVKISKTALQKHLPILKRANNLYTPQELKRIENLHRKRKEKKDEKTPQKLPTQKPTIKTA